DIHRPVRLRHRDAARGAGAPFPAEEGPQMSGGTGLRGRRLALAALLLASAAVAASAASAARSHTAATTFKIGWISGLTGSQATNSQSATQGLAAAVKVINKTHVAGKNIQFQIVTVD